MRTRELIAFAVLAAAGACVVRASGSGGVAGGPESEPPPEEVGPGPGEPGASEAAVDPIDEPAATASVSVEELRDESGRVYRISQGVRGDPAKVGCADGQREAFVDGEEYPAIAGCLGSWTGAKNMRARPTGRTCGDDATPCAVPSDLCAPGWRVCGSTGAIADVRRVSADQCEKAGGGRFSAAISHCETQDGCVYDTRARGDYPCFAQGWCSETVCCGADCGDFGACRDGVWPGKTHIAQGVDQGCGATTSQRAGGILCCHD
jgi:hypothetical protein